MPGESLVNVTEGSGKKLHTWQRTVGANSVEDEVVLHGEPHLATYALSTGAISIATVNDHVLQIMAGASLNVYLHRVVITQSQAATTAGFSAFGIVRLTSAGTGGTAKTANPFDTSDAAAGCTGMTLPTVKGTEGAELMRQFAQTIQTIGASGAGLNTILWEVDFDKLRAKKPRIPAGAANGLAVKILTATAGASVNVWAIVSEASY